MNSKERFHGKAADGFNVMGALFSGGLEDFITLVVPELRRRGLFREEYEGRTLRENLGITNTRARQLEQKEQHATHLH